MPSISLPSQASVLTPLTVRHAPPPLSLTGHGVIAPGSSGGADVKVQPAQTLKCQTAVLPQPGFGSPSAADSAAVDMAPPAALETPTAKAKCVARASGAAVNGATDQGIASTAAAAGKATARGATATEATARGATATEATARGATATEARARGATATEARAAGAPAIEVKVGAAADEETAAREATAFLKALGAELKGESGSMHFVHCI